MSDAQAFTATLDRWQREIPERMQLLVQGAAQTLANEISVGGRHSPGTPVDTGFARSNWQAGVNRLPPAGTVAGQVAGAIQTMQLGDTLILANHAPYIARLEFGFQGADRLGRTFHQAGRGFIRLALAAWQAIVDEVGTFLAARDRGGQPG